MCPAHVSCTWPPAHTLPLARAQELFLDLIFVGVAYRVGVVLKGSFYKLVRHRDSVWTLEPARDGGDGGERWVELKVLLAKSDETSWKKLFPEEDELNTGAAIAQICEDDEPIESYMDLTPEARKIVDIHREYRHAKATGEYAVASDLEEEMKLMRFNWPKEDGHLYENPRELAAMRDGPAPEDSSDSESD